MTRFAVGLIAGALALLALLALLASAHQGDASAPAGVHLTMTADRQPHGDDRELPR